MDFSKALDHLVWYMIFRFGKRDFNIRSAEHLQEIIMGDLWTAVEKIKQFDVEYFEKLKNE